LNRCGNEEQAPQRSQLHKRKFDADREEQQDHADLGQDLHGTRVGDQIESVGADQCPGHQKSRDRREPELMKDKHDGNGHREDDEQIAENGVVGHAIGCQDWV